MQKFRAFVQMFDAAGLSHLPAIARGTFNSQAEAIAFCRGALFGRGGYEARVYLVQEPGSDGLADTLVWDMGDDGEDEECFGRSRDPGREDFHSDG